MKDYIDQYWEKEALPSLIEFGKIPNVSPAYAPQWKQEGHMDKAAEYLALWAKTRPIQGLLVDLHEDGDRTPMLVLQVPATDGSTETILMYGHLDKQPPMTGWRDGLDPWIPVREGDLLYGRGLADDGYAIFAALGAIEAVEKNGGTHPRIVILIEASEESGSPDLMHYIEKYKAIIGSPSAIITLDAEGRGNEHLWLTQSLRGIVNGYLTVNTFGGIMHSGLATGVVPSAMRIVRMLLDRIEDVQTGTITNAIVNPPITPAIKKSAEDITATMGDRFLADYHLPTHLSAARTNTQELVENNIWNAGLEITGITGLPHTDKAGNVTVGQLTVKVSIRIPPCVAADAVVAELKRVFEVDPPYGATVTYESHDNDSGWFAGEFDPKQKKKIWSAAHATFGTEPMLTGIGASIPFVGQLSKMFPAATQILTGVLSHDSNAHGPNENLHIPTVKRVTEFVARFISSNA